METQLRAYLHYLTTEKHLAQNSLVSYERDLKHYFAFLKEKNITNFEQVQKAHVQQFLRKLQEDKRATSSIMRMLSSIKNFHLYLQLQQITTHNPASSI